MELYQLNGDYGQIIFESSPGSNTGSRYLSLNTQAALFFFKRLAIQKPNILLNSLGLYSFAPLDNRGEARFASLNVPKHILRPGGFGCAWDPVKGITGEASKFSSEPYEFQAEQCPDLGYETAFRGLYGTGNAVRDVMATPEGKAFMMEVLRLTYQGLGNSFYDVASYANHPFIALSDENDYYTTAGVEDEDFARYKKQQSAKRIMGHQAIIQTLKNQGMENMNAPLSRSEISADGKEFIGDIIDLLDRTLDKQNSAMKRAAKGDFGSNVQKGIILASPSIFRAYEKYLIAEHNQIPAVFYYTLNSSFVDTFNLTSPTVTSGALKYKGYVIVEYDEFEDFGNMTGIKQHILQIITPGLFGTGLDIPTLEQFGGLGMRLTQHLDAPWLGKIFMDTRFDLATGLVNPQFMVNASIDILPTV